MSEKDNTEEESWSIIDVDDITSGSGGTSDWVTKEELSSAIEEALSHFLSGGGSTTSSDVESEEFESLSPAQIEKIAERKVQEAIRKLQGVKKETPTKKVATTAKVAPKKEPEAAPEIPGKMSLGQRLWGQK